MKKNLMTVASLLAMTLAAGAANAQYAGLYVTEVISQPTADEMIEVTNTSGSAMDVAGVIVSDEDNNNTEGALKFPAGTTLAAGEVVVIAVNNSATEPSWLDTLPVGVRVFHEPARSSAGWVAANGNTIAVMDDYVVAAPGGTGGNIALGGTNDNVTLYVPTATFTASVGIDDPADCIDGMNYGGTPWAPIAPSVLETVNGPAEAASASSLLRNAATANAGSASRFASGAPTVGTFAVGGNVPPALTNRTVTPIQPTSASALSFSVDATDTDGTIASVTLFHSVETDGTPTGPFTSVAMPLDAGDTYTLAPAALATLPTGSVVFYYFETADDDSDVTSLGTAVAPFSIYVNDNRPAPGDVVINEIVFTGTTTDWFELANASGNTYDLSYYRFSDSNTPEFVFPYGTTLAANGFLCVAENLGAFATAYPAVTNVIGGHSIGLGAGGDTVEIFADDATTTAIDTVSYTAVAPWTGVGAGRTAELISLADDNSLDASWSTSAFKNTAGSPGVANWAVLSAPEAIGAAASINVDQGDAVTGTTVATVTDNQDDPALLAVTDDAPVGITITYSITGGTPTTPGTVTADVAVDIAVAATTYTITATVLDADTQTDTFTFDVVVDTSVSEWMLLND